ncbi:Sodium/hydrogen exchanger [Caenorhabditis elegans]|nr:Sodium/hydrogen exchanger [Caenorhabditis elegans]AAM18105.1 putative Na-H exchanger isoform 4b [Caenorhabditis elegans]CCD64772.1 Sodium/hydrogen exchanger [Caenorhabditis elegans]|eukprot:NP_001024563.1 Sodium/hydrogen exchanger [Caenorhabditis elegans]
MDAEGEWVQSAPPEEIEEAKHLLDPVHVDFEHTHKPLAFVFLIILVTLAKPTLHWPVLRKLPESVVLMLYGVLMATAVKALMRIDPGQLDTFMFFMILLPAIVNDAGLSMQKKEFTIALPKILLFAVVGTVVHALLLAATMYGIEPIFSFKPGFLHLFVFATLISAVDPVSVLSTFAELDVKKSLFILIFGESLCNDAVTIVLYRTSINVIKTSDASDEMLTITSVVGSCVVQFMIVCGFGLLCGAVVGFAGVFIMKNMVGHQMNQPIFQLFCPYLAYLLAETGHYSGILASILCAAIMSYYMAANMCVEMEFAAFTFSKTGSSLSESCIFFYLGVSLVSYNHEFDFYFIAVTVFCCTLYRFLVTCTLSAFYNLFASEKNRIPFTDQLVVTHAGIRGAVCFGLVQIIDERIIPAKPYFVTTTLAMIFVTSILQGCTIKFVMKCLKIPGDDGTKQKDPKALRWLTHLNDKYIKKFLVSENTYLPTDETFRNLGLPKAVSTALRIGERSHTDLQRHGEVSHTPAPSVGRPTIAPFDFGNMEEENNRLPSTGRRTPVARSQTRYSRHFIYAIPNETDNYLTCPVSASKRPPFDPSQVYQHQNTISNPGDDRARCYNRRHNSMSGADEMELKQLNQTVQKKLSRTITSGTKQFVVNPDEAIREESPATIPKKRATFEDDEISKIDESE